MSSKKKNVEEIPAVEGQKSTKRLVKVVVRKGLRTKIDRRRGRYKVKSKKQKEAERKAKEKKEKRDAKKALKESPEYKLLLKQLQELQKKLIENEKKVSSSGGRSYGPIRGVGAAFGPQQSGTSKQDIEKLLKEQQEKLQKQFDEFKNKFVNEFSDKRKKDEDDENILEEYSNQERNEQRNPNAQQRRKQQTKRRPSQPSTSDINIQFGPFPEEETTTERIIELDESETEKLQPESKIKPRGLRSLTYKPNPQLTQQPTPQQQQPTPEPEPIPHRQSHEQAQQQTISSSKRYIPTTPQEIAEQNRLEIQKLEEDIKLINENIKLLVDDYNKTIELALADEPPTPDTEIPPKITPSISSSSLRKIIEKFENDRAFGIIVEKLNQLRDLARDKQRMRTSISEKRKTL
jgi:translation initiation factor 5B